MSQHFEKYQHLRAMGASAAQIYLTAKGDGLDEITCIRLLRQIFDFSLTEAKEAMIIAEKRADSLEQYQERLLVDVENLRLEDGKS